MIAHAKEIERIHDDLLKNLDQPFSIAQLAKDNFIDVTTLQQEFKLRYGAPIASYIRRKRIEFAIELLKNTDDDLLTIAKRSGYQSRTTFSRVFKDMTGLSPQTFRRIHQNHD